MRAAVLGLFFLALPFEMSAQTQAYDLPIREHVFDNGLRLLVLERPTDFRVAAKIFTDFGAMVEIPGQLGAAHFLEHLMFKGTRSLGTFDWAGERPIRERLLAVERDLIAELNRARNELRPRGVMDDYRHRQSTARADSLRAEIARLEREAARFRDNGAMMRWYQAYGGTGLTATTEQEYMKFDINLPVERVELFLRVEADRMRNSVFREFDQERMIVLEQRYGDLNRPTTPYYEAMNEAVGAIHPVYWNEGYLSDFDQYTRHYERDLYTRYFVPNNTTLVFVGGATMEALIPLVERYFGWMERAPEPARIHAIEPRPRAERRLIWRSTELAPRVEARFQIPGVGHPDRAALDVLAEVAAWELRHALATAGIRARVDVNTRVVHTRRFGVPASLNLEVILEDEFDLAAAESHLLSTLDRLARSVVARERLQLAQKTLRTEWYRTARDADALAFEIGHFQVMDSWRALPDYLAARDETTLDRLRQLAEKYFVAENRTIGIVRRPEAPRPRAEVR